MSTDAPVSSHCTDQKVSHSHLHPLNNVCAVLPSGTSLPFGAMVSKMKRNRMMEDIMEVSC